MIMIKKTIKRLAFAICMIAVLTACNKSDEYPYRTDYLPVQLPGSAKWSILNVTTGELAAKDVYDMAPSPVVGDMYYVMDKDGNYNYYNVADPKHPVNSEPYGSVTTFSEDGLAVASKRGGALCVINTKCEVVRELPKDVSQCSMFTGGRAAFQVDRGQWGYINTSGDTIIPARYATVNMFLSGDKAVVVQEGQGNDSTMMFTIIDKQGKEIFSKSTDEYKPIQPFYTSGILPVLKGDSIVCLNGNGEEVDNPNDNHQAVDSAHYADYKRTPAGYFIVVGKDGKKGLVDKNNKVMIPAKHAELVDLRADRYIIGKDSLYSIVDENGKAVGNVKFVHAHGGNENLFATRGFIDTSLAVNALMGMFDNSQCCGASPTATLMDMNGMIQGTPDQHLGQNTVVHTAGPFVVQYIFDGPIALVDPTTQTPTFNLEDKVQCVIISLNVGHCPTTTEEEITGMASSAMGTNGFVLDTNDIFTSENGSALTMGYEQGVFSLYYFMDRAKAKPFPRIPRK